MQMRQLGRTGIEVSLLTFGCGAVGGLMTKGEPADQLRTVERALELGVNFFDTAPLYGDGASEINLGRILAELQPNIVLGTKFRLAANEISDVGEAVDNSLTSSLSRLKRDHVDLLQLHNPIAEGGGDGTLTPDFVIGEVLPAFQKLKAAGRVRAIGLTAIGDSAGLGEVITNGGFDTAQIIYNLINPSAGEAVPSAAAGQDYGLLLEKATSAGMGTIVIRALAGGALSGIETRHPLGMPVVAPIGSGRDYRADVDQARQLSQALGVSDSNEIVELAIRYVASNPLVSTLQVGIATLGQFEGAAKAVIAGPLDADTLARISEGQGNLDNWG